MLGVCYYDGVQIRVIAFSVTTLVFRVLFAFKNLSCQMLTWQRQVLVSVIRMLTTVDIYCFMYLI